MKHKKHELIQLLFDFHHCEKKICSIENDNVWKEFVNDVVIEEHMDSLFPPDTSYISPFEQSDRPDIIYHNNDFAMGIECFEFDASKKSKKGSNQRCKEKEVDREQNIKLITQYEGKKGHIVLEGHIDAGYSFENYSSALVSTFMSHAQSIEKYRKSISDHYPEKKIYAVFYIDDVTALGNYVKTPKGLQVLYPLKVKEFLTALSETHNLDYVVLKFKYEFYVPMLVILKNEKQYLDMFMDECFNPDTDEFIQYTYEREGHIHRLPDE